MFLGHPCVRDAAVEAREDRPGEVRLVAYVVPAPDHVPTPAALRTALSLALPAHMVPGSYMLLDALPLTPNGKLDRRALPTPGRSDLAVPRSGRIAPRDALERQIAQVWEELLGVDGIAIHEGFFDLGGHSLLALTMIDRLAARLGKRLSVAALFGARHGWSRLVREGLEIYMLPSDHFSLLREPILLREVARVLRTRLARAERELMGSS